MSQIAALLLMFLTTDEEAFWGLHQLMVNIKYNMHAFFIPSFPKLQRFQDIHDKVNCFTFINYLLIIKISGATQETEESTEALDLREHGHWHLLNQMVSSVFSRQDPLQSDSASVGRVPAAGRLRDTGYGVQHSETASETSSQA